MEAKTYYKQVACIQGRFYSIFNPKIEYVLGETLREKPKNNHKGGFFVYSSFELAAHAEVKMKLGTNWIFPRIILKVECWGELIQYPKFKLCFEYIKPLESVNFPTEYLTIPRKNKNELTNLQSMKNETEKLEQEVAEMEARARRLGIR